MLEKPNPKDFGLFFGVIYQLRLPALDLLQSRGVQEGRTRAPSPQGTLESHHFFLP